MVRYIGTAIANRNRTAHIGTRHQQQGIEATTLAYRYYASILLVSLPAGGLLLATGAAAQSGTEESTQPTQLDEINVIGRREFDDRFMSNATRLTISRRDIEAMGANSIGDILRQTPGLQVTTTANGGIEIRMRGMGPESTRILIDGIPASANNRTSQLPLDDLPADLIERIE